MRSVQYPLLSSPIRIGAVQVPNRVVFPAHLTNLATEDNLPSVRHVAYHEARARGGTGLIIIEEQSVHASDHAYEKLVHAFNPRVERYYEQLTTAIHRHDTRIFAQISHNGGQGSSVYTRRPVLAPSPVADHLFREVPKAIEQAEIDELVKAYADVAERCLRGGFDGVELQCSHSSIMRQFLSPRTNLRQDRYGGDLTSRMRFLVECLEAIRASVDDRLAVGVRVCGDELLEAGITMDETVETAVRLEQLGLIDFVNTSIGTAGDSLFLIEASMAIPPSYALFIPAGIRREVSLPVIGVGRIKDPSQAEAILAAGYADLVGIVRGQIADPDFTAKSLDGRTEDIRLCLSCNQECVGRVGLNRWIGCIQTVSTGRETTRDEHLLEPAATARRVAIVGGGPGGMEAARVAAVRGHAVTLFERDDELGGRIRMAARAPARAELDDLVRNLRSAVLRLEVDVRLGHEATAVELLAGGWDSIIVATGARYDLGRSLPGGDEPWVFSPLDLLEGRADELIGEGSSVLVVDGTGFHDASSATEILALRGADIDVVTSGLYAAGDLGITLDLELWHMRMRKHGVRIHPNLAVLSIGDHAVEAVEVYGHVPVRFDGLDAVVLGVPPFADDALYEAIVDRHPSVIRIGDAAAPRKAHAAIIEGHEAARSIT